MPYPPLLLLAVFFSLLCSLGTAQQLPLKKIKDPAQIDRSLVVYNAKHSPLNYPEYFPMLWKGEHYLETIKGKTYLKKYPDSLIGDIRRYSNRLDSLSRLRNITRRLTRAEKVLVIKSTRKMYILRGEKIMFEFPINLGKNPIGHKQKTGDGKTPEGEYTLDFKMWTAQYYRNFHISYPNANDIKKAQKQKTTAGEWVMVHGTSPNRKGKKDWTNGCIALTNAQMDTLFAYVPVGTLIEIKK